MSQLPPIPMFPYDSRYSAEKSVLITFSKVEFIELWQDSPEPFEALLAHDLPEQINVSFHYVYFYDPEDGTVSDYSFQHATFAEGRLLCDSFGGLADMLARKTLEPVLEFIEGQCSPFSIIND